VLIQRAAYTCKHVLAARLALATNKAKVVELNKEQFDVRIKQLKAATMD
jgi:predicted nucleic acid-binding Zn finger protein